MTKEKLLQLIERYNGSVGWSGTCHDCGEYLDVTAGIEGQNGVKVSGGAVYEVTENADAKIFLKCDKCYKKDGDLKNFQECEVYSRVVGYLRPVSQWNDAKQEEFKSRKTFDRNLEV